MKSTHSGAPTRPPLTLPKAVPPDRPQEGPGAPQYQPSSRPSSRPAGRPANQSPNREDPPPEHDFEPLTAAAAPEVATHEGRGLPSTRKEIDRLAGAVQRKLVRRLAVEAERRGAR